MAFQLIRRAFSHIGTGDDSALESMERGMSSIAVDQENDILFPPADINLQSTAGIRPTTPPNAKRESYGMMSDTPTKVRIVEQPSPLVMRVSISVILPQPARFLMNPIESTEGESSKAVGRDSEGSSGLAEHSFCEL